MRVFSHGEFMWLNVAGLVENLKLKKYKSQREVNQPFMERLEGMPIRDIICGFKRLTFFSEFSII